MIRIRNETLVQADNVNFTAAAEPHETRTRSAHQRRIIDSEENKTKAQTFFILPAALVRRRLLQYKNLHCLLESISLSYSLSATNASTSQQFNWFNGFK